MWKQLFQFNKTNRPWHLPVLAGICVGLPILIGYLVGNINGGKLAGFSALVILYIQSQQLAPRMAILLTCSAGFIFSAAFGFIFAFNNWVSPIALGLFAALVHHAVHRLKLHRPPGSFFFIMMASIALCMPYNLDELPTRMGYVALGVMGSCTMGFIYSIVTIRQDKRKPEIILKPKSVYINITESIIIGAFVGFSLLVAKGLEFENPYWIPTSCLAVMQGINTKHVWTRSLQRIIGTLLGIGLAFLLLQLPLSPLAVCFLIIIGQTAVEFFIVRNYVFASIFLTIVTMLLAEPNINLLENPSHLIQSRLIDIVIGSIIGSIGGWALYHEKLHFITKRQLRKTKVVLKKYQHTDKD